MTDPTRTEASADRTGALPRLLRAIRRARARRRTLRHLGNALRDPHLARDLGLPHEPPTRPADFLR